jgi:hypothetical protein
MFVACSLLATYSAISSERYYTRVLKITNTRIMSVGSVEEKKKASSP